MYYIVMSKILFVEDDQAFYNLCAMELKMKGYDVVHIAEGAGAVEKIRVEKPTLVLLDIVLPGMNGLDILKELKEDDDLKDIKVAMLTNFGMDENVNKAMDLGANEYFMKYNIVLSELPDKIGSILGSNKKSDVRVTG
jgi:DNA-binding response OmpR family regulator